MFPSSFIFDFPFTLHIFISGYYINSEWPSGPDPTVRRVSAGPSTAEGPRGMFLPSSRFPCEVVWLLAFLWFVDPPLSPESFDVLTTSTIMAFMHCLGLVATASRYDIALLSPSHGSVLLLGAMKLVSVASGFVDVFTSSYSILQ